MDAGTPDEVQAAALDADMDSSRQQAWLLCQRADVSAAIGRLSAALERQPVISGPTSEKVIRGAEAEC